MSLSPRRLRFRIVNVFATGRAGLTGNPLCVFEDAALLEESSMQALARQFNLSESTFILPAAAPDAATVRIFTPSYEMPFAGHPTLGTAHVCRALGRGGDQLRLRMRAGSIPVRATGDRWTLRAPRHGSREVEASSAELAQALGLDPSDLADRPLWVKAGKEQLIVPLASTAAVERAAPRPEAFFRLRSEDGISMAYVFAHAGPARLTARFFFRDGDGVREDPATGSAAANLGGWWIETAGPRPTAFEISQGARVGRPSRLHLEIGGDGEVCVGGEVVEVARGEFELA